MQCFLSPKGHLLLQPTELTTSKAPNYWPGHPTAPTNSIYATTTIPGGFFFSVSCHTPNHLRQNDPAYRIGHAHIGVAQGKLHQFIAGMRHLRTGKKNLRLGVAFRKKNVFFLLVKEGYKIMVFLWEARGGKWQLAKLINNEYQLIVWEKWSKLCVNWVFSGEESLW